MGIAQAFRGGIHPTEGKNGKAVTQSTEIVTAAVPARVMIPLSQHGGAPADCIVKAGQTVNLGQVIGTAHGVISASVHASVSGKVVAVTSCQVASGKTVPAVVIENDYEDRWDESVAGLEDPSVQAIVQAAAEKGIVGLGGAAFPTAVKLDVSKLDPKPDTLIINGSECEPYLTSDHRLMVERADAIIDGIRLAMKATDISRALVGIEANKPDAISAMQQAAGDGIEIVSMPVRYPQGYEKMLIYTLTGRKVPAGALPSAVQCVVLNVATCEALSQAVRQGRPIIDRVVTLGGNIANPGNYRVRIGTNLMDLLDQAGGFCGPVCKAVVGGPMMGATISTLNIPVTKNFSGFLALGEESIAPEESPCIRCGRCVRACPMGLMPTQMDAYIRHDDIDSAVGIGVMNCMECGSCTYVCPAKRELTQSFRMAKTLAKARKNK